MKELWIRLENWLKENAAQLHSQLNIGVSQSDIESLESTIELNLPRDFIDFYKVHDGQEPESEGLIDREVLLSFYRILSTWETWKSLLESGELDDDEGNVMTVKELGIGIKNCWWNVKWIPITSDGCGKNICIDLDPAEDGTIGQIIEVWSDIDARKLLSFSFKEWMSNYIDKLDRGQYIYSSHFGIVDKDSVFAQED